MTTKRYFVKVSWVDPLSDQSLFRRHDNEFIEVDIGRINMWDFEDIYRNKTGKQVYLENFTVDFMMEIPEND